MSQRNMSEHGVFWASDEDRRLFELDATLYGTAFVKRDPAGYLHRVDPTTITVSDATLQRDPDRQGPSR